MWHVISVLFLSSAFAVLAASADPVVAPSCADFNPKTVKLITFDVFAALMDLETSLIGSVKTILPDLDDKSVTKLVQDWEGGYSSYAGTVFDISVTGPQPFQWMLNSTLTETLSKQKLTVTDFQFSALIKSWGNLTPWVNTKESLAKLYNAGYLIGALSNGDRDTLNRATSVFLPEVKFTYIFPSDFPVGSFKPDVAMYKQLDTSTSYSTAEMLHVAGASSDGWGAMNSGHYSALLSLVPYPKKPFPCFLLKDITGVPPIFGL
eukprot:gene24736-29889_t